MVRAFLQAKLMLLFSFSVPINFFFLFYFLLCVYLVYDFYNKYNINPKPNLSLNPRIKSGKLNRHYHNLGIERLTHLAVFAVERYGSRVNSWTTLLYHTASLVHKQNVNNYHTAIVHNLAIAYTRLAVCIASVFRLLTGLCNVKIVMLNQKCTLLHILF